MKKLFFTTIFLCQLNFLLFAQEVEVDANSVNIHQNTSNDKALIITQENNEQVIRLHLANNESGKYGYFNLGGTTTFRGNGQASSFQGTLSVGDESHARELFKVNGSNSDVIFNGTHENTIWSFVNKATGSGTRFYVEDANYSRDRLTFNFTSNKGQSNVMAGTSDGNVGIGTSTPRAKLHILKEGDSSGPEWSYEHPIQIWGDDQDLQIGVDTENRVSYFQSVDHGTTASNISLNARGGNVGIGTVSPTSRLFLKQSSEKSTSGLSIQDRATRTINIYGEGASGRQVISTSGTNNPLAFILNGTEAMRLDNRGHVGIGTTNLSDFKLSVDGKIRATEVKVYTGWADYVFEEDYHLKSLSEVEAHIKEHKHLPDVPSAKEVEENGVNVGETEAMLLRKIEELTLYIIEQQKLIDKQNEKINKFEKLHKEIELIKKLVNEK